VTQLSRHAKLPQASAPLKRYLKDNDRQVRLLAVLGLDHADAAAEDCVPVLAELAEDGDAHVRGLVAERLGAIDAPEFGRVAVLIRLFQDDDKGVSALAKHALSTFAGKSPNEVAVALQPVLRDGPRPVRLLAFRVLGPLGPAAGEAIRALRDLLGDQDPQVRFGAIGTLAYLKAKEAVPQIADELLHLDGLTEADMLTRAHHVLDALAYIGEDASAAIPTLLQLRDHPSADMRAMVNETLTRIDPRQFPQR
jgi:HEAT repeat protein